MTAIAHSELVAVLEELATALDTREFAMILVTGPGQRPCLTVTHRFTHAAEDIYADHSAYWWAWVQPIAATSHPLAAAHQIMALVRADPGARIEQRPASPATAVERQSLSANCRNC